MEWMNIPFWIPEYASDLVSLAINSYNQLYKAFVASECYLLKVMLLFLIATHPAVYISCSDS
jgi:hypothetical protein